jgi:hypothetical protein
VRQRLGREQHLLVLGDVVVERAHREEVERPDLHAAELLDLAVRREDPRAVGAQLAVLPDDAELDREPEHVGEELQRGVGLDPLRGPPGQLVERGEVGVGERVRVPDDLVDQVGLGRVQRLGGVADVLGRVELPRAERGEELAQRNEAGRRHVRPAGQRRQARGDLVELRDAVRRQAERRDRLAELARGVLRVLGGQLAAHRAPHLVLGVRVFDARDGVARPPVHGGGRDRVAPLPVGRIVEPGVVLAEVHDDPPVGAPRDRGVQLGFLEHDAMTPLCPADCNKSHAKPAKCAT